MKKIYSLMVAILVMLGCVSFSACGDDYKNLNMKFYSNSGEVMTEFNILWNGSNSIWDVTNSKWSKSNSVRIGIEFNGIKAKNIGEITVESSPKEMCTISNYSFDGNMCYVNVTPQLSGSGSLVVEHLASGKTASINLVIDKQSTTVTAKDDKLILVIPEDDEGVEPYEIVHRDVLNLDTGSTDTIRYRVAGSDYLAFKDKVEFYIETITEDNEISLDIVVDPQNNDFTHIRTLSGMDNTTTMKIYPIVSMEKYGIGDTPYTMEMINVVFYKTLTDENVIIYSNDKVTTGESFGGEYKGEEITLIVKDDDTYDTNFSYNTAQFVFQYDNNKEDSTDPTNLSEFLEYYIIEWETSSNSLFVVQVDDDDYINRYIIQAGGYSGNLEKVKFRITPRDAVGQIETITKVVNIKPEVKPSDIKITMQDEEVEGSCDLYDYYAASGNGRGARFQFATLPEYAYDKTTNMRIVIAPELLNADYGIGTGVNPCYSDYTYTNKYETQTIKGQYSLRNNKYVLNFYIGNEPMKFTFNTNTNKLESELIDSTKYIYIKYTEIETYTKEISLSITIKNVYTGDIQYLKTINGISKELAFNRQDGVTDMIVNAGVLTSGATTTVTGYGNGTTLHEISNLYLNVNQDELGENQLHVLCVGDNGVAGYNKTLDNANFTVSVTTKDGNIVEQGLKLVKIDNSGYRYEPSTTIRYEYEKGKINSIGLFYNQATQLGIYIITITHTSGYIKTIEVEVYEELTSDNIKYNISTNEYAVNNVETRDADGNVTYKYKDYKADYIVSSKLPNGNSQTLDFAIELVNTYTNDYITNYSYETKLVKIAEGGAISEVTDVQIGDYINVAKLNNVASLTFIKGTYIDEPCYISLTITLNVRSYENIVKEKEDGDAVTLNLRFYVYDLITKDDFIVEQNSFTRYANDLLGGYYKDESKLDLEVELPENLWNYVLPHAQYEWDDVVTYEEETEPQKYSVVWYTSTSSDQAQLYRQGDKSISLIFNSSSDSQYTCELYAEVWQFGTHNTLKYIINVYRPIITERVIVTSPLDEYNTDNYDNYISLKAGIPYKLEWNNYSSKGIVTHPEIVMKVTDSYGNESDVVSVDDNIITLNGTTSTNNLKLIIYAKDALEYNIDSYTSGLLDSNYLLLDDTSGLNLYKKAYVVIDLILSDGSETNPYLIRNAKEFWEINRDEDSLKAYYKLMNNIDISNTKNVIDGFSGSIVTNVDNNGVVYSYSVYGLEITDEFNCLFDNFAGSISNVNFITRYNVNASLTTNTNKNYGVFGLVLEDAKLTNVTVNISGEVKIGYDSNNESELASANFGGLVAVNKGTIKYTSTELIGVYGNITLSGAVATNAGGVVGVNYGTIIGCIESEAIVSSLYSLTDTLSDESTIKFTNIGDSGAIANINIVAKGLEHDDSVIGGVIGLNSNYEYLDSSKSTYNFYITKISNIYVTGSITGVNNIGGVIGKNISNATNISLSVGDATGLQDIYYGYVDTSTTGYSVGSDNYKNLITMRDAESNVIITATGSNAGGLVGSDENGVYYHNNYKILTSNATALKGNENVGGLIGNAKNSMIAYSYVSSYRWGYTDLNNTFVDASADIVGEANVGGLVGNVSGSTFSSARDGSTGQSSVIHYSSVNAYIQSSENTIGGLIGNVTDMTKMYYFILDTYFMGYIDCGDNVDANILVNTEDADRIVKDTIYIVNRNYILNDATNDEKIAVWSYKDNRDIDDENNTFIINGMTNLDPWAYDADINGGYIYITYNGSPLVDLTPTSLTASVKDNSTDTDKKYYFVDTDSIHFNYYNVNISLDDENYADMVHTLEVYYNTYSITNIMSFTCTPTSITTLRLNVSSSDTSVVFVSGDKLIVKGEGSAVLTFTSVLNNAIKSQINVTVSKPLGETLILSESSVDTNKSILDTTQNITKGKSKQYYLIQEGDKIERDDDIYEILTNDNVYFDITVEAPEYGELNIGEYIGIGGKVSETNEGKMSVSLDSMAPFSISVYKHIENVEFSVTAKPYKLIAMGDSVDKIYGDPITFSVATYSGAYDVSLSHDSVILYPNDTTVVTAYISTDIAITEEMIDNKDITDSVEINGRTAEDSIATIELIDIGKFNSDKELQLLKYRVTFINADEQIKTKAVLRVYIQVTNGENASVEFTVLPQRIDNIDIKNYNYTDDSYTEIESSRILRPNSEGLIIINVAPVNAYYDYVEITDVTGKEEIDFEQVDAIGGKRLSLMDMPATNGKGIKLQINKNANPNDKALYVQSRISNEYSNIIHRVKVVAYLSDGTQIGNAYYINIDVRMLPSINATYVEPNGNTTTIKDSTANPDILYLANGVSAEILVNTRYSNGSFDYELHYVDDNGNESSSAANDFNVTENERGVIIDFRYHKDSYLDNNLAVKFTTSAVLDNGTREYSDVTLTFKIVKYVIHSVSVTPSVDNQIYGNYTNPVNLEFYFDTTDISFYDNGTYWSTEYWYNEDANYSAGSVREAINNILQALNNDSSYLSLKFNNIDYNPDNFSITNYEISAGTTTYMTLSGTTLTVNSNSDLADIEMSYNLDLSDGMWTMSAGYNIDSDVNKKQIFDLSFVIQNSIKDAIVIFSEEEFLNMQSGDVYYILGKDITLGEKSPYTPLDIKVSNFDGNGHTITIKQFDTFTESTINVGLFKQVYEGMVVSNVTVNYNGGSTYNLGKVTVGTSDFDVTYADLCNGDVDYSAVNFGGITPTNEGIITNCRVTGEVAFTASTVENKVSTDKRIQFYMGGLVTNNSSKGYITHSTSELRMFGVANIGGFVYSNAGKIVSSSFSGEGLIYSYYNTDAQNSIERDVAGFVINNTGDISMSYCDIGVTRLKVEGSTIGNLSSKDPSAGFVFNNSGTIKDTYIILYKGGLYSNNFDGYVAKNNGTITNSYSYINQGQMISAIAISSMFAPSGTTGITNSYEIKNYTNNYNNGVKGLTTLIKNYDEHLIKSRYIGFNFGDNKNSIWTISSGDIPRLVSTLSTTEMSAVPNTNVYGDKQNVTYHQGIKTIVEYTIEEIVDENTPAIKHIYYEVLLGNYGTQSDPYLIYDVETWNEYMADTLPKYYRIVKDIDFSNVYTNPATSTVTFTGNMEGNNMTISGYMIYGSYDSIGLFESIVQTKDKNITTLVKNITIKPKSILASTTTAVGALAGIVEDVNIYNITADASDVIIVGGNAVGGIIGIARGALDIEGLSSNIGVNSIRTSSQYTYSTYVSKNNSSTKSNNLRDVYYAGSVIGIIDAYDDYGFNQSADRDISKNYYYVKDITVSGNMNVIGDSVGTAFGFVGERVYVDDVNVSLSGGNIAGVQYTGGIVGENRGVITNAVFTNESAETFANATNVIAGIVGFNVGGLVINATSNVFIDKTDNSSVVAGIVGRNVNGTVASCVVGDNLRGYITGGVIGADYTYETLSKRTSGSGSLTAKSIVAVPTDHVKYEGYTHLNNTTIADNLLNYWFENISYFYDYKANVADFSTSISYKHVLGLVIGARDTTNTNSNITTFGYNNALIINDVDYNHNQVGVVVGATLNKTASYDTPLSEIITKKSNLTYTYVTYLVGTRLTGYDNWSTGYSEDILVFTNESNKINSLSVTSTTSVFNIEKVSDIDADGNSYSYYAIDLVDGSISATLKLNIGYIIGMFDANSITSIVDDAETYYDSTDEDAELPSDIRFDVANKALKTITFTGTSNGVTKIYSISFKLV